MARGAAVAAALATLVSAQAPEPQEATGSDLWFVQLSSPPATRGTGVDILQQEHDAFRASAIASNVPYEERLAFRTLVNGISVRTTATGAAELLRIPGVRGVYPVPEMTLNAQEKPNLSGALQTTGAAFVQNTLGFTGKGVRIAIIDTGVDYHHPDLGGCFGPGCKVVGGYDFVGDNYTSSDSLRRCPIPTRTTPAMDMGRMSPRHRGGQSGEPERRDGRRAGRRASRLPGVRLQRHGIQPISSWPRWNVPSPRGLTSST